MIRYGLATAGVALLLWTVLRSLWRIATPQPGVEPEYDPYARPFGEVVTIQGPVMSGSMN